ncbi:Uncharacterized protein Fot_22679 [Forsythia ovata]|uniref:Uncharacterized protein n=1 Tax=Forsythia ovata TaxID=205694 RepID=A0ABD1UZF1_9LAMI
MEVILHDSTGVFVLRNVVTGKADLVMGGGCQKQADIIEMNHIDRDERADIITPVDFRENEGEIEELRARFVEDSGVQLQTTESRTEEIRKLFTTLGEYSRNGPSSSLLDIELEDLID